MLTKEQITKDVEYWNKLLNQYPLWAIKNSQQRLGLELPSE